MADYAELRRSLGPAWAANKPDSTVPHVLVVLPSFSVGESLLAHYAPRIPALEHRYLLSCLLLPRVPGCELVFLTCEHPGKAILDYYASLLPAAQRAEAMARFRIVEVPDHGPRPIAAKLLDRPDLLAELRSSFAGRPVLIEPWNVTAHEAAVAERLGAAINGTAPDLWPLGFKSAGRKLFAAAGVPTAFGFEDLHSVDEVIAAITEVRDSRPQATGAVIKHDDSGAGDGNAVIGLRGPEGTATDNAIRQRVEALPEWYLQDIALGCVVEELVSGVAFASPSAQVDITPYGGVEVLSTHDQVLDQATGQVYTGCKFPAHSAYAGRIAHFAGAVGGVLARRGAVGRFSVDFAATSDARGRWQVFALENNLRKGGTTHPFCVLRTLVPGRYDQDSSRWISADGTSRTYYATDNLVDPAWLGVPPNSVISFIDDAGLRFDPATRTGVVLHMLSCLAIDGRFGLTAIGTTAEHAAALFTQAQAAVRDGVRPPPANRVRAASSRSAPHPVAPAAGSPG